MRRKNLVVLILAATLIATSVPFSTKVYARNSEEKRAEKFIELARRAGERVGNFINLTYANETAKDAITSAGLFDQLEGNKTLYRTWGLGNLTAASIALDAGDFSAAINNATQALSIFRDVFRALNIILEKAEVKRGELIDAQGLIIAMRRAVERIERIRSLEGVPEEVLAMLDSAEEYLDVETAITWLSEGKVNQTALNLTQANRLISQAHRSLKKKAEELNAKRIESYLRVIEKLYNINRRWIGRPGAEERLRDVKELIEDARSAFAAGEYMEAIARLTEARNMLRGIRGTGGPK